MELPYLTRRCSNQSFKLRGNDRILKITTSSSLYPYIRHTSYPLTFTACHSNKGDQMLTANTTHFEGFKQTSLRPSRLDYECVRSALLLRYPQNRDAGLRNRTLLIRNNCKRARTLDPEPAPVPSIKTLEAWNGNLRWKTGERR